jgi:hypothetical protein
MKDIIDLGNSVFNHLVKEHAELEESRTLFLYGITMGNTWFIIDSAKWIIVEESGLTYNFDDPEIAKLDKVWKDLKFQKELIAAQKIMKEISPQSRSVNPQDGDTFEFWNNETPWREINL